MSEPDSDLVDLLLGGGLLRRGDFSGQERIGRYELLDLVGEGAAAKVYRARDARLDRVVALKVLSRADATSVERFQREIKLLAGLSHPNLLRIYESGVWEEQPFYAMAYVNAGSLAEAQPSLDEALRIVVPVALACHAAHEAGIVHRDLKPANILLAEDGPLVSDFGVAKLLETEQGITRNGVLVGTPAYMAPEQVSAGEVDARTDVYALGVILYELLTGQLPYDTDVNLISLAVLIAGGDAPTARERRPELPASLDAIVMKAMATDPAERYPSAQALAEALLAWRRPADDADGEARPAWPLLAGGVAILAVGSALLLAGGPAAEEQEPQASGPVAEPSAPATPAQRSSPGPSLPPSPGGAASPTPSAGPREAVDPAAEEEALRRFEAFARATLLGWPSERPRQRLDEHLSGARGLSPGLRRALQVRLVGTEGEDLPAGLEAYRFALVGQLGSCKGVVERSPSARGRRALALVQQERALRQGGYDDALFGLGTLRDALSAGPTDPVTLATARDMALACYARLGRAQDRKHRPLGRLLESIAELVPTDEALTRATLSLLGARVAWAARAEGAAARTLRLAKRAFEQAPTGGLAYDLVRCAFAREALVVLSRQAGEQEELEGQRARLLEDLDRLLVTHPRHADLIALRESAQRGEGSLPRRSR